MARQERRRAGPPTRNAWDSTLDHMEGGEPTQAGESTEEDDDARHRDTMGIDGETGLGGYGGDAGESGHDEAVAQPDRPADVEIHGDPRTRADEFYPDEEKVSDEDQGPIGDSKELRES